MFSAQGNFFPLRNNGRNAICESKRNNDKKPQRWRINYFPALASFHRNNPLCQNGKGQRSYITKFSQFVQRMHKKNF